MRPGPVTTAGGLTKRQLISNTVRPSVLSTFRTYPGLIVLRQRWPTVSGTTLSIWSRHARQVREVATGRSSSWFGSWLQVWRTRAAAPVRSSALEKEQELRTDGGPSQQQPRPKDDKYLPPEQLRIMLNQSADYCVHRTNNPQVGMLQVDLVPESDPSRRKNFMSHEAIYATIGLDGIDGYGDYFVVFDRRRHHWRSVGDPPTVIYDGTLTRDDAVGWFHLRDLQAAKK